METKIDNARNANTNTNTNTYTSNDDLRGIGALSPDSPQVFNLIPSAPMYDASIPSTNDSTNASDYLSIQILNFLLQIDYPHLMMMVIPPMHVFILIHPIVILKWIML